MADHYHENCQALLGSLSEYIDGELPPNLCEEIEKHLEGCENCRVVLNTTKRTIDLVRVEPAREPIPDDVRERLFLRLNLDDFLEQKK
ncbi:MAG: zf-HC2 domain-containing protein [Anaerolineales bacterium]|jgi:anti-sigma factor (TIGR02949 family)|nr:zf-HC2 domain-containing protein [Chloroflexota bacterium]MBK6646829.1 zf-HC2 domain-containing protein [Anaerolineales bacterium]MCC6985772.1 zf-HC2 domain-containing protein [Anaerolineales bacterium]